VQAPSWSATREADIPVFLAPPHLRSTLPVLVRRAASRPATLIDGWRAGADLRAGLRFLLWLDTARCFGITELDVSDEVTAALSRHLPPAEAPIPAERASVTGLIIAKNEEECLPGALDSLAPFADELLVVDDLSTDATAQIATDMGARVLRRELQGNFADQRNAGLAVVRTEWAVCIDADERLEPELIPYLHQAISWPRADAVWVPTLNYITAPGEEPTLVHWPNMQVRIFRTRLRYQGAVHEWVGGWHRPVFTPLSGPYVRHEKTRLNQHRSTLLYNAIDPTPYTREEIASVKEELVRLEHHQPDEQTQ
jgi:Glycosyl transferase family 2